VITPGKKGKKKEARQKPEKASRSQNTRKETQTTVARAQGEKNPL